MGLRRRLDTKPAPIDAEALAVSSAAPFILLLRCNAKSFHYEILDDSDMKSKHISMNSTFRTLIMRNIAHGPSVWGVMGKALQAFGQTGPFHTLFTQILILSA
jgi:hypothetical protein